MTAQGGGATAGDGVKRFELLVAESLSFSKPLVLRLNDVGHLDGEPCR